MVVDYFQREKIWEREVYIKLIIKVQIKSTQNIYTMFSIVIGLVRADFRYIDIISIGGAGERGNETIGIKRKISTGYLDWVPLSLVKATTEQAIAGVSDDTNMTPAITVAIIRACMPFCPNCVRIPSITTIKAPVGPAI